MSMASKNTQQILLALVVLIGLVAIVSAYSVQDAADEDYYPLALANYLRRQQAIAAAAAAGGPAPQSLDKRACLKRNAFCSGGSNDCCEGNACRCNLFGSNCRCQRAGLLQKLI